MTANEHIQKLEKQLEDERQRNCVLRHGLYFAFFLFLVLMTAFNLVLSRLLPSDRLAFTFVSGVLGTMVIGSIIMSVTYITRAQNSREQKAARKNNKNIEW